ncbi:MAG: hypothetical protein ACFFCQ_13555, partial [Promethearchaeota archaeon]
MADMWFLYYILAMVGFFIGVVISKHLDPMDPLSRMVLDVITTKFLDEKSFKPANVAKIMNIDAHTVEAKMDNLARNNIIRKTKRGWYRMENPLVFLTERDIMRAERITKNDNLLYGGYQEPFLSHLEFFAIYNVVILALVFDLIAFLELEISGFSLYNFLAENLPEGDKINGEWENLTIGPFLLFTFLFSLIIVDALENLIKAYGRERYSVIIGAQSGVSFDTGYADEFSGRVPRGRIRGLSLDISAVQKIWNYVSGVPRGNIKLSVPGRKAPFEFKNMPFPRELFYVVRSIQLKSLGWRKKHARTLMMWRANNVSQ